MPGWPSELTFHVKDLYKYGTGTRSSLCLQTEHIDGLVQGCSISNANALEILQNCTKRYTGPELDNIILNFLWRIPQSCCKRFFQMIMCLFLELTDV